MSGLPGFLRGGGAAPIHGPARVVAAGSLGLAMQGAPWRFALQHDRAENLLVWITRGQGRATINGVRRGVSTHSALFLPAGTLFALDLQTGVQALHLAAPPAADIHLPGEPLHLRVRDSQAQAELTGEIDAIGRELARPRTRQADALSARLSLVAVWLHRQLAAGAADVPKDGAGPRLVRRFAQAVVRDHDASRPVASYADALDVTATHLTRACRAACGQGALDILTERRVHAARTALETQGLPVSEIARRLGFASPAYFSRFIAAQTGKSPSALRRAARPRASG